MTTPPRSPTWARAVLLAILGLDVWWRCHTIGPTVRDVLGFAPYPVVVGEAEPLDCDEAAYAYIGRGLARGAVLYRDLSENKPPLGYWLYTMAVAVGGANQSTIRLMSIPYAMGSISLVWWIGLRLRGPAAGCVAAFLYLILSTDPYLYGNGSNMEHFLNLFAIASLAAMIRSLDSGHRRWVLLAGILVGAASLVKQVAAVHGPIDALALLLVDRGTVPPEATRSARWASRVKDLVALAAGFGAAWAVAVGILWLQGAGPAATDDIVGYGSALATLKVADPNAPPKWVRWITGNSDPLGRLPWPFGKTDYLVWWGSGSWPIWLASIPTIGWLLLGPGAGAGRGLAASWTLSAWVQVALPGLFWAHYYLLPTPGLALCLAVALADAGGLTLSALRPFRPGRLLFGAVAWLGLATAGAWTVRIQVRDYLLVAPEALTVRYKGGGQWVVLRAMGRELGRRTAGWPHPTLYVWGWQSPLFVYSGLDGVTRHFFADPLLEDYARGHHRDDPRVRPRAERIIRDLRANPPDLAFVAYPPFPELRRFLEAGYVRSPLGGVGVTRPDGLGLWVARERYRRFEAIGDQRAGSATGAPRSEAAR